MNSIWKTTPSEITDIIFNFTGKLKRRNGIIMNQIDIKNFSILLTIPRIKVCDSNTYYRISETKYISGKWAHVLFKNRSVYSRIEVDAVDSHIDPRQAYMVHRMYKNDTNQIWKVYHQFFLR